MKKRFKISKKNFKYAVLSGLICAVLLSFAHFNAACDEIKENVLRLHIIANSDSEADQAVKLLVKDSVIQNSGDIFENSGDIVAAANTAKENLELFEETANKVLLDNGFSYSAKVSFGQAYFETREYDDFTLPAGYYDSLIITLGEGQGKNWWCVIFPEVCLPAASDASLNDTVSDESVKFAKGKNEYIVRFKAVEIYEKIKKALK